MAASWNVDSWWLPAQPTKWSAWCDGCPANSCPEPTQCMSVFSVASYLEWLLSWGFWLWRCPSVFFVLCTWRKTVERFRTDGCHLLSDFWNCVLVKFGSMRIRTCVPCVCVQTCVCMDVCGYRHVYVLTCVCTHLHDYTHISHPYQVCYPI